jgi:hypothetical protein
MVPAEKETPPVWTLELSNVYNTFLFHPQNWLIFSLRFADFDAIFLICSDWPPLKKSLSKKE